MSNINEKIELISTEQRSNYIKSFVETIKGDFQTEIKENGINTYEFPVLHDVYRAYMTDDQIDKTVEYAIDIIEELKKQNMNGLTGNVFEEKVKQVGNSIESYQICLNVEIKRMVHEIDKLFLLDPAASEIIVNQELYSVIFAIYKQLVDKFDDEEMYQHALDLLIRGIMRMGYEPL